MWGDIFALFLERNRLISQLHLAFSISDGFFGIIAFNPLCLHIPFCGSKVALLASIQPEHPSSVQESQTKERKRFWSNCPIGGIAVLLADAEFAAIFLAFLLLIPGKGRGPKCNYL